LSNLALVPKPIIHLGIYKGIGDFIGALVAVASVKSECLMYIYTYGNVSDIVQFDLPTNIKIISLGRKDKIRLSHMGFFIKNLIFCRPNYYLISDFSVNSISFSKIFQIIVCRLLSISAIGSVDDWLSFLYQLRLPSSKNIELIRKDYVFLSRLLNLCPINETIQNFSNKILRPPKKYKYIIHIGASTINKRLSPSKLQKLISKFSGYDCAVIGTKYDFFNSGLSQSDYSINFLITSFDEMLSLIKYCEIFIGYDSAAANIANLFGKQLHIISGAANSNYLYQRSDFIKIHRSHSNCQACGKPTCVRKDISCMNSFDPDLLFESIIS